jgi:hypothetical protein
VSPVTHFLTGWVVANTSTKLNRRERALITLAGVIPDLDGLGIIAEALTRNSDYPLLWWTKYHHVVGHNLCFGLIVSVAGAALAPRRWLTATLIFVSFHLHLLTDLVGSRGPDGYQWPIRYLFPFTEWEFSWSGQWELNAWPNFVITGMALLLTLLLARKRGFSPLEMVSTRGDQAFIKAIRQRYPLRPRTLKQ